MAMPKPKRETVGAAWRSRKGLFTLVALGDAERMTGHQPGELRELHGVQTVTRIYVDGTREEALRVPSELVLEQSERAGGSRTGKIARS
jgi:hypothetical protein